MTDTLERILAAEDPITPSSGFARGVMAELRRQQTEPPPLPFPWWRFALGVAAVLVMAAAGASWWARVAVTLPEALETVGGLAPELGYAALAVAGSLALACLPRVFAR
jgi:hypothetical protein